MTLRETLAAMAAEGRLTPRDVVDEARTTPGSALHQHIFGVSDDEAAERWRLDRARNLIRSFRVTYAAPDGTPKQVRQFVSLTTADGHAYQPTETVVADEFTHRMLLQSLERDVAALQRKYGALDEFAAFVRAQLLGDEVAS